MNSEIYSSKNRFLFISGLINLIILGLVIQELIYLIRIQSYEADVKNIQSKIPLINIRNIDEINSNYSKIENTYSSENSLVQLLNFIETNTSNLNLKVISNKALEVTNSNITYQLEVSGDMGDIYQFISRIESDKTLKEITESEIKFRNGVPTIKIVMKSYKL